MNNTVIQKLKTEYLNLDFKTKQTALKYYYQFNKVDVNVFFDAYDELNPSLSLILHFDKDYYYTSLNINDDEISNQYLEQIQPNLLVNILDDKKTLNDFYIQMNEKLNSTQPKCIYYKKDTIFTTTLKIPKKRDDLPFIDGLRKVRMNDITLIKLSKTMSIERQILKEIQNRDLTIVRTSDPERRKKLILILQQYQIQM